HRAVAATQAPDRIDARIAYRSVEISESRCVIAREITLARERVRRCARLPAERARVALRALEICVRTEWARGREQGHTRADGQRGRGRDRHAHLCTQPMRFARLDGWFVRA